MIFAIICFMENFGGDKQQQIAIIANQTVLKRCCARVPKNIVTENGK
jgi:hypothetical protein